MGHAYNLSGQEAETVDQEFEATKPEVSLLYM